MQRGLSGGMPWDGVQYGRRTREESWKQRGGLPCFAESPFLACDRQSCTCQPAESGEQQPRYQAPGRDPGCVAWKEKKQVALGTSRGARLLVAAPVACFLLGAVHRYLVGSPALARLPMLGSKCPREGMGRGEANSVGPYPLAVPCFTAGPGTSRHGREMDRHLGPGSASQSGRATPRWSRRLARQATYIPSAVPSRATKSRGLSCRRGGGGGGGGVHQSQIY